MFGIKEGQGGCISDSIAGELKKRIEDRTAVVAVVGLGYVGLPLVAAFHQAGFHVIGFDTDEEKIRKIDRGECYLKHLGVELSQTLAASDRFEGSSDPICFSRCDSVHICVPTPLDDQRKPDLGYVESSMRALTEHLRPGSLVVLESTSYPGTTREVVLPILEEHDLELGKNIFVAFSPEREDPGRKDLELREICKLIGGLDEISTELAEFLYSQAFINMHSVKSAEIAEAAKILENIYRSVNIALVNEMKVVLQKMDIDIWEVIKAADTKPFGFKAFYPGPGLGGHCIPIDPFYLSWRAQQKGIPTRFIELAGEINTDMPKYVVSKIDEALKSQKKSLKEASVLLLGIAYKPDVDDTRETPAAELLRLLKEEEVVVSYHDPHIPTFPSKRNYLFDLSSVPLTAEIVAAADCVVVVTDHRAIDWQLVADHSSLIVDTRNAVRKYNPVGEVWLA
ncbi:MAG: nucleotide sugar dehydrogenase [Planctomycetota bacterium]